MFCTKECCTVVYFDIKIALTLTGSLTVTNTKPNVATVRQDVAINRRQHYQDCNSRCVVSIKWQSGAAILQTLKLH